MPTEMLTQPHNSPFADHVGTSAGSATYHSTWRKTFFCIDAALHNARNYVMYRVERTVREHLPRLTQMGWRQVRLVIFACKHRREPSDHE